MPNTISITAGIAKNTTIELKEEDKVAKYPPIKFPKKEAVSHTPINRDINFAGASLVTIDKPTGDRQSSPQV